MAFLRPDADDLDGNWTTQAGSTTLFNVLDEETPDDADYIRSGPAPVNDIARLRLSDPVGGVNTSQDVTVRYRYGKSGPGKIDMTVRLKEGTTTRATWTHTNVGTSLTTAAQVLSGGEKSSIADWSNLFIEFEANQSVSAITIENVSAQTSSGDVPISYTIDRDDATVKAVVFAATEPNPTAAQMDGGGVYVSQGTVSLTNSGSAINLDIVGAFNGSVKLALLPTGGGDADVVVSSAFILDTTAPTLSALTGTQTGQTTANAGVTSNEAGGVIYFGVRPTAATVLTAAQLIAGAGGAGVAWATDTSPLANSSNAASFTGLTAGTAYRVDAVQVDSKGNTSAVVSSAEFTTAAAGSWSISGSSITASPTVTPPTVSGSSITG